MSKGKGRRQSGIVGPLILIGLGVVLLLNNLGLVDWSLWEVVLRLWPVLLVAAGLDLILGRRSAWGSLLALVLTLVVLGLALWLSQTGAEVGHAARTEIIAHTLGDESRAEVIIDPGVGSLRIEGSVDSGNLIEGTVRLGRGEELVHDSSTLDEAVVYSLESDATSFGPFAGGWAVQRRWDLKLSPEVPLVLRAELGVGEAKVDLTGLELQSFELDLGIGQALVVLPDAGSYNVKTSCAIGQTVVVIPESLAVRAQLDTGIAARQVPAGYDCDENVCTSPGYETASARIELELSQPIGSLVIRH